MPLGPPLEALGVLVRGQGHLGGEQATPSTESSGPSQPEHPVFWAGRQQGKPWMVTKSHVIPASASHPEHRCHLLKKRACPCPEHLDKRLLGGCCSKVSCEAERFADPSVQRRGSGLTVRCSAPFFEAGLRWNPCSPFQSLRSPGDR